MARRIVFARPAEADLDRLAAFIASESRGHAERAVSRIRNGIRRLGDFPQLGVAIEDGFRQLILRYGDGAYIVRYRVLDDVILVTSIVHSREDR